MRKALIPLIIFCLYATVCFADEVCKTEWCNAKWPPEKGSDRAVGKDNCGNVCIKIVKEVEKVVIKENEGVAVTLATDDKGRPIFKASCPATGLTKYDYKLYKAGYVQKSRKKGEFLHIYYEKDKD